MEFGGTRRSKEFVPGIGSESGDAGETGLDVTKLHRPNQARETRTKLPQTRVSILVLADAQHQENCRPRKRTDDILRKDNLVKLAGYIHFFNRNLRQRSFQYRI